MKDQLTTTEAAKVLGIKNRYMIQLIQDGKIAAERFGRRAYIIKRAELNRFKLTRRRPGRPFCTKNEQSGTHSID